MSKKKCKCPPQGAPEWMATFSDMMSLLLCFFVLIVAFSEIKEEEKYQSVVEEIKTAFGMHGGGGRLPTDEDPELSLIQKLIATALYNNREPTRSSTFDPGVVGREPEVTRVREGEMFARGTAIVFEPAGAELTAQGIAALQQVAQQIKGHNNIVQVRGHAETVELEQRASEFPDLWALSHARAKVVMDWLISPEGGQIRPERVRLIACADHEPKENRGMTLAEQAPNRRVEVFEIEATVDDLQRPE